MNLGELQQASRMGPDTALTDSGNNITGLIDLINYVDVTDKVMCEIGCYIGVSTETFLQFKPKKFYAVDIWGMNDAYIDAQWAIGNRTWATIEEQFRQMTSNYSNVEVIKDFSVSAADKIEPESLDLVYIDGEHTYEAISEDIAAWTPKVKPGGWVCGHDYGFENIRRGVQEAFSGKEIIGPFVDTSWAVQLN